MKYVVAVSYYPNCRSCDSGYFSDLKFYSSLKSILKDAQELMNEYEFHKVYNIKGLEIGSFDYNLSFHRCHGMSFNLDLKNREYHTIDDGHGNKIWTRK